MNKQIITAILLMLSPVAAHATGQVIGGTVYGSGEAAQQQQPATFDIGSLPEDVLRTWGYPYHVEEQHQPEGAIYGWLYERACVVFVNGRVYSWRTW